MMNLRIKRAYEEPDGEDGTRILVDRLWPRGLTKEKARIDLWLNDHHLKGGGLTLRLKVACLRLKPLESFPAESRLKARSAL